MVTLRQGQPTATPISFPPGSNEIALTAARSLLATGTITVNVRIRDAAVDPFLAGKRISRVSPETGGGDAEAFEPAPTSLVPVSG